MRKLLLCVLITVLWCGCGTKPYGSNTSWSPKWPPPPYWAKACGYGFGGPNIYHHDAFNNAVYRAMTYISDRAHVKILSNTS